MIFKKNVLERPSIYRCPEEAGVTLLNSICNFDFVVTIVIVQMCLAFEKVLSRSLDLD
jgi:hypothetical protein